MTIDVDALIAKAHEMFAAIEPIDVPVVIADRQLVVRVPFVMSDDLDAVAGNHPPRTRDRQIGAWFNLAGVTRDYPGVELVDGEEVDDLFVLREKEAVYRWPEVYDALAEAFKQDVESAVWGLHVYRPKLEMDEATGAQHG